MNIAPLEPVGAVVTDLPLADVTAEDAAGLAQVLAEHGVLVFPGQHLDNDTFTGFLRRFGDLTFTVGETPVEGHPDLNLISNVGRTSPPKSTFHVDTSYVAHPPAYTALRAVTIPEQGGATLFTNQYRAYETLPEELRDRLDGHTITHQVTGLDLGEDAETSAEHPVFREHPLTGRRSLYLSTPARCVAVSGLDDDTEAEVVVRMLFEHSTSPENTLRHAWSAGDVVMWDNACVLHKADHSGVVGDRVMHRGMVASYPAVG
ncbi:MAG: TauD/TfdA family dioxygenase [Ornithinimicrobium sp.]